MYIEQRKINLLIKKTINNVQRLSKGVLTQNKPKPGPYMFFSISGQLISKLESLKIISGRLYINRKKLKKLDQELHSYKYAKLPPGPVPKELNEIHKKQNKITGSMWLDFESLYIYSGIILDLWSLLAIRVYKINKLITKKHTEIHPFTEYIDYTENNCYDVIREELGESFLWLYYNQKNYRNRIIMHSNRPWQMGISRSYVGDDFYFYIPSPPGRNNTDLIKEKANEILKLLKKDYKFMTDQIDKSMVDEDTVKLLFNNIYKIKKKDIRDKISGIYYEIGGASPSFQIILERVVNIINEGTMILINYSKKNKYDVDIGKSQN